MPPSQLDVIIVSPTTTPELGMRKRGNVREVTRRAVNMSVGAFHHCHQTEHMPAWSDYSDYLKPGKVSHV